MSRPCAAPGCAEPVAGYSTHCERHKRALRRHGHPDQEGVTVHELKPFRDRVAARRAKNRQNPAWGLLADRWGRLVSHAEDVLKAFAEGKAGLRHERIAAARITTLAGAVPAEVVVETALAMFFLQDAHPQRFRSDRAFDFQLARRVLGLTEVNAGTYWDDKLGKVKRVYRDTPPQVLETLARYLKHAFGAAGLQLALLERQEARDIEDERKRLDAALKDMQ